MFKTILLWITVPVFETLSQICMKFAALSLGNAEFSGQWFIQAAHSGWFLSSLLSDFCCFLCWMAILKNTKLSVAFPLSSVCFITVLLAGWGIFGEPILWQHFLGTGLILLGIYFVSREPVI